MQLYTGIQAGGGGHAFANWPGTGGTAANATAQGPATASEAAFGVTAGGGGMDGETAGTLLAGVAALVIIVCMWYALPR